MTMVSHLARNLRVGLWMETVLFLLLTGSLEIKLHQELWSFWYFSANMLGSRIHLL